jgi:hypothetical protein
VIPCFSAPASLDLSIKNENDKTVSCENSVIYSSVADPDHFDTDPDPTSEKTGCGSDHARIDVLNLFTILFYTK